MTDEELDFVTYCISNLAVYLKKDEAEIYCLLSDSGAIFSYIIPGYDVLHSFGKQYLMNDLTSFLRERGIAV